MHQAYDRAMTTDLKNLLEKASVSLLLDTYDDIFSDFDPRPYSERALSDDFLIEAKKATREITSGLVQLHFLIPKTIKNTDQEALIKERLHHHFKKHEMVLTHEVKNLVKKGSTLAISGFFLMFFASVLSHYFGATWWADFLRILCEPAGWFLVWYGLDQIFYFSREKKPELDFYKKMMHAEIHFEGY